MRICHFIPNDPASCSSNFQDRRRVPIVRALGFGHLRGTANWYLNPPNPQANQLETNITLDPSNLSELATLVQGEDIGVHGSIGGHAPDSWTD